MSNSSSLASLRQDGIEQDDRESDTGKNDVFARLLDVIIADWLWLGKEFMRLGEALSSDALARGDANALRQLQLFDKFSQTAEAQALFLGSLVTEYKAAGQILSIGPAQATALIANVALDPVRHRLMAALNGETGAAPEDNDADAVCWL